MHLPSANWRHRPRRCCSALSAAVQVDNDLRRYYELANGRSVAGGIRWRM